MTFVDEVNLEIDRRNIIKAQRLISESEIANAPIISISECCGGHLISNDNGQSLICSKCRNYCEGVEDV